MSGTGQAEASSGIGSLLHRHPPGLFVLFFAEMWERFSYYGMRSLLVFYMISQLRFSQPHASTIYGWYTGLAWMTPFFGGIIADRWLGRRRSVVVGGTIMALGHFLMAIPSMFFPALGLIVAGNGLFKPNISTQVGDLYPAGDPRRDRAFGIFYVGINAGALLAPIVCGTLGETLGWHYGFAAAGVGMVAGLLIYCVWIGRIVPQLAVIPGVPGTIAADTLRPTSPAAPPPSEGAKAGGFSADERRRIGALVAVSAFAVVFWAAAEQQGNTLALWAQGQTERHLLAAVGSGWEMPASWFQAFNPAMIFLFTPMLTWLWARQARRGREPHSLTKMAFGCLLVGASFLVMIGAARAAGTDGKASILWLVAATAAGTLGELYLSPVGLSLVTKIAPVRVVSMMMGVFFLSNFGGSYLAGYIGTYWETMPKEMFFLILALLASAAGVAMLGVLGPLKRAAAHNGGS